MKIGLIDIDGRNFPNLPLMKLSAYHKRLGDEVKLIYALSNCKSKGLLDFTKLED